MLHQLTTIVADSLQHAVKHDTIIIHDTVHATDTVRVLVHEGGLSVQAWLGIVLAALPIAGGAGWKLRGLLVERRHAHQRINTEASSLHRELQASTGNGPQKNQASVWTQQCQRGFDIEEARFNQLMELALNSSKEVRHLIGKERQRFLDAAIVVNESLVGAWDTAKAQAADQVYREFQRCLQGLSKVIDLTHE